MSTPLIRRRVVLQLLAAELDDATTHAALACRAAQERPADLHWHMTAVRAVGELHEARALYAAACTAPLVEA